MADPKPTPTPDFLDSVIASEGGYDQKKTADSGAYERYINGSATDADLRALIAAEEITLDQAQSYKTERDSSIGGLQDDLVGLFPVTEPGNVAKGSGEWAGIGEGISRAFNPDQPTPYYRDAYGELYDRGGNPVTEAQRKRLLGLGIGGTDSDSDPYAGARDARDAVRLQEQIRAQRISEVENQQAAIQKRLQDAQSARLAGAQFAVTPSMQASGGYFPGLDPSSPLVRQGLAQPFQYQAQGFNPERGVNPDEAQLVRDLEMIRRVSGG